MPMPPRRRIGGILPTVPSELRMKQIISGPYGKDGSSTYAIIGLGTDGVVYRYSAQDEAWIAYRMKRATESNFAH